MTIKIELFGRIGEGNNTWQNVYSQLAVDRKAPVEVRINSDGGDLQQALGIYSLLKNRESVTTRNVAVAASSGSVVFMAGKDRVVDRGALTFVHSSHTPLGGDASTLKKRAAALDAFDSSMVDIYASATGQPRDVVEQQLLTETLMAADDAIRLGYGTALGDSQAVAALWTQPLPAGPGGESLIADPVSMTLKVKLGLAETATDDQVSEALDRLLSNQKPAEDPKPANPLSVTAQPDLAALVSKAVADAFVAREAAAAIAAPPAVTQEELHKTAAQAAVERFITEGKIPPASRDQAIQACGATSASLSAVVAYWEHAPRVVAAAQRMGAPAEPKPVLQDYQRKLIAQSGMSEAEFVTAMQKGRN